MRRVIANEMLTSTRNSNQVNDTAATITICLPYKRQRAAGTARKQMRDLNNKTGLPIKHVLTSPLFLIGNLFKFGLSEAEFVAYTVQRNIS